MNIVWEMLLCSCTIFFREDTLNFMIACVHEHDHMIKNDEMNKNILI